MRAEVYLKDTYFKLGTEGEVGSKLFYCVYVHPSISQQPLVFPIQKADIVQINERALAIVPSENRNVFLYLPPAYCSDVEILEVLTPCEKEYRFRVQNGEGVLLASEEKSIELVVRETYHKKHTETDKITLSI